MVGPLIRKLESFASLAPDDCDALDRLCADPRAFHAGEDLIRDGDRPDNVFVLIEGWAFRYKLLADGRRQIVGYLIPGDLCDPYVFVLRRMDHSIGLLSPSKIAVIAPRDIVRITEQRPTIAKALWWSTLVDESILREWLTNLGQRDAFGCIAHFFCEMWLRMRAVGLVSNSRFSLPLTQADLADTLGMTSVHANRVLQRMRRQGLITLGYHQLTIHDPGRLAAISDFEPNYLHLSNNGDEIALPPA